MTVAAKTPDAADDLAVARRVLTIEGQAVLALRDGLDDNFVAAVDLLAGVRGRAILSGMGKSGHIGRKIAATLASTGTPAQFVHPGEASHGDLGMITPADVVVLLSNSGETPELGDLIAHTKRFNIPLIGIAGRAGSTLLEASTVGLLLPGEPEACPNGLAPTTSTTMTLALGDALAVALMERAHFSADQFAMYHPGGKLGQLLLRAGDLCHKGDDVPLCLPTLPMSEALILMSSKRFGCVGVTAKDGTLAGIITDGDLRRHMAPDLLDRQVGEIMQAAPLTISEAALASEALGVMNERKITCLFVVSAADESAARPVGILHIHDCLRAGLS